MAETIVTIDIATQIKSGIATALGSVRQTNPQGVVSTVTVVADGVRDETGTRFDSVILPCVFILVHEGYNHERVHNSKLREYDVTVGVATHWTDDPWQLALYTIAQAVGDYLLTPPTLTLAAATFRALYVPAAPVRDETADRVQRITWEARVGVLRS